VKLWTALAAVLSCGLLVLAALVGTRPDTKGRFDMFPLVGDPIEATMHQPAVAAFLAAMLLVLLIGAVRGARLRWLAYAPGPVDVADLKVAGSVPDGVAERLTLHFRQRLADLHLATPGPQPGMAPATGFVDLIGSATRDSKNLLATVAGLLRTAWPSQAYQVQATLVHDAQRGCGVSVQVVMLPATTTPPTTCWAVSWEMAIDCAANRAAAFILPRTRVCRDSRWAAWYGYVLPPQLLEAYEHAAVCTHERRYDEALREYYRALQLDPKNLEVRLRIGFIQEKLGLALDALTTYQATVDMTCDCPTPGASRSTAQALLSARRRSQTIASYRRAVLLGSAAGVSMQWCAPDQTGMPTRRDEQRRAYRERLRPTLTKLCQEQWHKTKAKSRGLTPEQLLAEDAPMGDREQLLCEVFQCVSLEALDELHRKLPQELMGEDQRSLTPKAIALSKRCVHLRLGSTRRALSTTPTPKPALAELKEWLDEARLAANAPWSERYSAASMYALAISRADDDAARTDDLAEEAVIQLERAIESADSGYVASRRAWLVSEDPDFDELRLTGRFRRFEATYFPSHNPTILRPPSAHQWEVVEYVLQLVAESAQRRQDLWRAQLVAVTSDGESDGLSTLWRQELQAWELVSDVASQCDHWQTRLKLVEALETWTAQTGGGAPLGYPDYADVAPNRDSMGHAHDASDAVHKRLAPVHAHAARQRAGLTARAGGALTARGQILPSESRAGRSRIVARCRERIKAWQTLSDTLKAPSPNHAASAAHSSDAVHAVPSGRDRRPRWRLRAGADRIDRSPGSRPPEDR
jgi:tetratricopeptide (TPR) repeat protein